MFQEIVSRRTETSKTYDLGGRKRRLESHIGAWHYKDNYADPAEAWKDIDLTIRDGRITAAPYELTIEGKKLTFKDKKTGEVSTLELISVKPTGIPFEIIPELSAVRFQHILPTDKVPFEAKFKVTGKTPITRAFDDGGELELETTFVDGVLTEKLTQVKDRETGQIRPAKGSIRIDPTWQVGGATGSSDDCTIGDAGWSYFRLNAINLVCGSTAAGYYYMCAARFLNVSIPQGATIDVSYLTFRCRYAGNVPVNSLLKAQDSDNADTFSNQADFDSRSWTTGTDWDITTNWIVDNDYDGDFASEIQTVINRPGWVSGNALAVLWQGDGYVDGKALHPYAWDGSTTYAPKLVIEYTEAAGWTHSFLGVANANIGNIMGVAKASVGNVNGVA